jgi:hypothetical protein
MMHGLRKRVEVQQSIQTTGIRRNRNYGTGVAEVARSLLRLGCRNYEGRGSIELES